MTFCQWRPACMIGIALIICVIFFRTFRYDNVPRASMKKDAPSIFKPDRNLRYFGRRNAAIESFPYHVSVQYKNEHICSGSIIDFRYILTVAHCLVGRDYESLNVRSGTSIRNEGGTIHTIERIIVHSEFHQAPSNSQVSMFDIALIQLQKPINYDKKRKPIDVNGVVQAIHEGDFGSSTGWGFGQFGAPHQLTVVIAPVISSAKCSYAYQGYGSIDKGMLCAGFYGSPRTGPCLMDPGAALVIRGSLAGLWSWGAECKTMYYPGVFTNVAYFRPWLKEKANY